MGIDGSVFFWISSRIKAFPTAEMGTRRLAAHMDPGNKKLCCFFCVSILSKVGKPPKRQYLVLNFRNF